MHILCFASAAAMLEKVSKSVISLNAQNVSIELYNSLDAVYQRLNRPKNGGCIAVLCLKSKKELHDITAKHDLFNDTKLILVLPKRDQDSIKAAYRVFPRFLAFADEDFSPLRSIIEKMLTSAAEQARPQ